MGYVYGIHFWVKNSALKSKDHGSIEDSITRL